MIAALYPRMRNMARAFDIFTERPLVTGALLYGAGILLGGFVAPGAYLYVGLGGAALFTLGLHWRGKRMLGGALIFLLMLGVTAGSVSLHAERPPEGDYTVQGVVRDDPVVDENGRVRLFLNDGSLTNADGTVYHVSGIYMTYYIGDEDRATAVPCDGLQVCTPAKVYHPDTQKNPYGFDFSRYLLLRGVTVGAYAEQAPTASGGVHQSFSYAMRRLRNRLNAALEASMGDSAPVASAMLLGDREGLADEMRAAFSRLGIAHILAVSGLHVGFLLIPIFAFPFPRRRWLKFALITLLLAFYCALVGFTASVLRAALLAVLYQLGRNIWRPYDRATALALAFLILLLVRPLDLYSAGFQLTFSALSGILLLSDPIRTALNRIPPRVQGARLSALRDSVTRAFTVGLAASAGVCLPLAAIYNQLSIIGLIVSPIACVVAFLLIMLYAVTLLLTLAAPGIGAVAGQAADAATRTFLRAVSALDSLRVGLIRVPAPNAAIAAAVVLLIILVSRYVLLTPRRRVLLSISAVALAAAVTVLITPRDVRYVQLSVNQADAAVIEDGRFTMVVDTGTDGHELENYLSASGRSVDYLILTHLHDDHAGGLQTLLNAGIPIGVVFIPDAPVESGNIYLAQLKASGVPVSYLSAGDTLRSERVKLTVLWPVKGTARESDDLNHYSLAMLAETEGVRMLLTGDLTSRFESYAATPADVLKVAHHGSAASTSDAFLDIVCPRVALLSCSETDSLPSPLTLARLGARPDLTVYNTNDTGALTLIFNHGKVRVNSHLPIPSFTGEGNTCVTTSSFKP